MKTPITIFSGYLGSGKTTIIINALKQYPFLVNFALIKNEYGDTKVDSILMQQSNLKVTELINGCLCCILVGSLNAAVTEIIKTKNPQRIIIEASGNALPFPIVLELKKNTNVYVDGVINVIDCEFFEKIKDTSMVAKDQAKYIDLVIFNKTGVVNENKLYQVKEAVYGLNPNVVSIDTKDGVINPHLLFGIEHINQPIIGSLTPHDHSLETFTYQNHQPFSITKLIDVLKACQGNSFYRIKGIVYDPNRHYQLINGVFGKITCQEIPALNDSINTLTFIGKDITKHQTVLFDYLNKATDS